MPAIPIGQLRAPVVARADLRFALLWAVTPNLLFAALSLFAAPMRTPAIFAYCLAGLLTIRAPLFVTAAVLAGTIVFDVLWFISAAYGLSIGMLADSLRFAWRVSFFTSPVFLALGVGVVLQFVAMLVLRQRWREDLRSARPYFGLFVAALVALADAAVNLPPNASIAWAAHTGGVVPSATRGSGFADAALKQPGDTLFVLLEGYGVLTDPALRDQVESAFAAEDLDRRYDIRFGETPFHGSTTPGELRELCGLRGDHAGLADAAPPPVCLPQELAAAGYETYGLHAFSGAFFDRRDWWPRIGLQHPLFVEELVDLPDGPHRACGDVFVGLCDTDLLAYAHARFAEPHGRPRFIYLLTLNTHIPLAPKAAGSAFGCGTPADRFRDAQTCAMADVWATTFAAVAALARDPALPPLRILLVGDHKPPSWTRRGRASFEPGVVRWISLSPKQPAAPTAGS